MRGGVATVTPNDAVVTMLLCGNRTNLPPPTPHSPIEALVEVMARAVLTRDKGPDKMLRATPMRGGP